MAEGIDSTGAEAAKAASVAAQALAPEAGLFTDLDPVSLARALARALAGSARNPLEASLAVSRYLAGLATAGAAAFAQALGAKVEPPLTPPKGDRRFRDPAWQDNPAFAWSLQRYLLWRRLVTDLVEAAKLEGAEARKAAFAAEMVVDALAPTNFPWSNPTALKKAFDTGGASFARGLANFAHDVVHNRGWPRQVDAIPFRLGDNLACTPGKVVFRNDLMELIQYAPQTDEVFQVPLLLSPPWINKYYIMDLAPGRSFAEWAVRHGHTVFAISYRNPDDTMRDVGMDDYLLSGPIAAIDTMREITGSEQVNVAGLCLGGTLTTMLLAYLAATGDYPVRSVTLLNTLIDFSEPGPLGVFTDPKTVAALERKMGQRGYLEGSHMRTTFDVLRANDLIWNYVASNWLMGEDPPAFDLLAWNADSTRMPAKMHSFYLRTCYLENQLAQGRMELDGVALRLEEIDSDVFLVGAQNDHIAPWESSYKTTQLLPKADVHFVLSSSGHIAGIVNPPNPNAEYWTNDETPPEPDDWLAGATQHSDSWWPHWAEWMSERAGPRREPPPMGSQAHPPQGDAPGRYVLG